MKIKRINYTHLEKLYILDISNIIHRAFHSMAKHNLTTKDGFPTGAIYGTFNILTTFFTRYKPQNILVCYDAQTGESVRKDIYPGYKANRVQVNAVSAQELVIRRMIDLFGIAAVEAPGYEADDLIASAVKKYKNDFDIIVVSGDKDLLCLVDTNVRVFDSMKDIFYGDEEVKKKFGVRPDQISDFLAIAGDSADCIPGVKGIGKKGAAHLLSEYDTIEDIYKNIEDIRPTLKKKLEADEDNAMLSKSLTVLHEDLDIVGVNIEFIPKINQHLIALLDKLDFDKSLIRLQALWRLYG